MSIQSKVSTLAQRYLNFWHSQTFILFIFISFLFYQLFWTQICPEGIGTNGTQVPSKVPSLPNPTTRKDWPLHRGLLPPLFSISQSAVRRDLGWSKFPTRHGQSEAPPRFGWWYVISMEFLRSFLRRLFARKPVVTSRNVGYFLKLQKFRTEIY